jgi:hypothetical protein
MSERKPKTYRDYVADILVIIVFALLFIPIVVVGLFRLIAAKNKRDFIKSITATQVPYPKQSGSIQHDSSDTRLAKINSRGSTDED